MTFVDVNPTILEDYKTFMHVDHEEKILYDSYIVNTTRENPCSSVGLWPSSSAGTCAIATAL